MVKYLILFVFVSLLVFGGYFLFGQPQKPFDFNQGKYTGSVEKITLALSKAAPELSSLIWIAQDKKYFEEQGIDLVVNNEENGIVAQKKVATGSADIGTTSDFAFVTESFKTNKLRVVAIIARSNVIEIIGRIDKKIEKPTDLRGKKIAVPLKTASQYFLGTYLATYGLSAQDVVIMDTPFAKMQDLITSAQVDAVVANDPVAYQIKTALGGNAINWGVQEGQDNYWILVSNEDFTSKHPQTVERFLKALINAEEFLKKNPEEGKLIVKNQLKLEQPYFDQTWAKSRFSVSLDQSLITIMDFKAQWYITNKLTDQTVIPHYQDYIYKDALKKVKPDDVLLY